MFRPASPFHPLAWLAWAGAALTAALITRNPLYLTLVLLAVLWVRDSLPGNEGPAGDFLRWAWIIPLFTMLANGLTIHVGESELFYLPDRLPLLGGPVTAEAMLFGFVSGYALVVLLAVFAAFNRGANYYALLRLVPGFLFQAGLVTSIALTFVPETLRALEEIRQAQQIRGHRFGGWRDLPPLFLPLLTMGLERSIQLAEAMESRGFGGAERALGSSRRRSLGYKLLLLVALLLLVLGIGLLLLSPLRTWALALLLGGLLAIGLALRGMGRKVRRSRYRHYPWSLRDRLLGGASLLLLATLLIAGNLDRTLFLFYPYPRLSAPPFDPLVGAALLVLALPAVLLHRGARPEQERKVEHHGNL